jgi:cytochrome P450
LVARQVQRPFEIQGWTIPAGVTVSACIYLTHHRPELYPESDCFQPERFLTREYSPYEWLPFGGGARRCLAMPLALLEMKIVLATILSSWDLELVSPDTITPLRRSVSIRPSDGTTVIVRRGRPTH